jgi:phosphoribosylglycinamide formyltransferase-1
MTGTKGKSGGLGILISGRGSNMMSLIRGCRSGEINAEPRLVISNVENAPGLAAATGLGVETIVIGNHSSSTRREHDLNMAAALKERNIDLVCLAGYMRLLSIEFIREFPARIMNIHPALLPAFPGLHAQRQAVVAGVRYSGATVHFVDEGLDTGPIILQGVVPVLHEDTEADLSARILQEEHRLYPEAVKHYFEGRLSIEGKRVRITG